MISYTQGDATNPQNRTGLNLILHVVNDQGGWGKGFVKALDRLSPRPQLTYRNWHKIGRDPRGIPFKLGFVSIAATDCQDLYVGHVLAQHGYKSSHNPRPLDYIALGDALSRLDIRLRDNNARNLSIHAPRLGCGLAGGDWAEVERLLNIYLKDYPVTVYDL